MSWDLKPEESLGDVGKYTPERLIGWPTCTLPWVQLNDLHICIYEPIKVQQRNIDSAPSRPARGFGHPQHSGHSAQVIGAMNDVFERERGRGVSSTTPAVGT